MTSALQKALLTWYARHGRATLPWRQTRDPYRILVSEFMLQQTQVERVIPKFQAFVERFPNIDVLARASNADVLREWKGLGYNSRGIRLKAIAQTVCEHFAGKIPNDVAILRDLPGVGPYTASALRAFAFDEDVLASDTNIRRVMHRLLYGIEYPRKAETAQLEERAQGLVPPGRAHDWNSALMDLGAALCTPRAPKCLVCPLRAHCAAAPVDAATLETLRRVHRRKLSPQEAIPFEKTTRFARGRIVDRLREVPAGSGVSLLDLRREMREILPPHSLEGMEKTLEALERDGIVTRDGESFSLTE